MDLRSLVDAVAQGVASLGQSPEGPQKIWDESRQYVTRLLMSASQKWIPYYARQERCHVVLTKSGVQMPCAATAVLPCDCCLKPTCLHHAQVDQHGDGTCYTCIAETIGRKRGGAGAPPPPVDMTAEVTKRALRVLGLKPGASWQEIRAAHRKAAAKVHPDKAKTETQRKKYEAQSVALNSALADLQRLYQKEARVA